MITQSAAPAWAKRDTEDVWQCIDDARRTTELMAAPLVVSGLLVLTVCNTPPEALPDEAGDFAANVIEQLRAYKADTTPKGFALPRPSQERPF